MIKTCSGCGEKFEVEEEDKEEEGVELCSSCEEKKIQELWNWYDENR